ncbi:unnamed protein product [Didymodactylos carnosus]|uniref:Mab-21-like HhH/H2TH-like domain-containing protein n=1 Tax=Didymodactylos carnosus TaxID=1234261 RepID=A0A814VH42_9BILA|nr:unnamed protein product [Didymodactylos carnosus]CAF1265190.1 unnamed protein product [Didymodactylos carnosus]CAF3952359.1 unnamed protein product [Didymodactylos carnosus]CAF4071426.1 unnamed protein product [Didymodactylos carnosus]
MLYFFGPTKSGSFEHSIKERWNITQELLKEFREYGHNYGFDNEIAEDDFIHQQFKEFKRRAIDHNYHPYFSGSFIESFDIQTPFRETESRFYQYDENDNDNNHCDDQKLASIVEQGTSEMGRERNTGHLPSDFDLLILDMNKWIDTSPNHSRTECQYQVNEQSGSHIGYVQIVEKQSQQPLQHSHDHKEILLGALLFGLNTLGEELVSVPDFKHDMTQHGPAITMTCQTRVVADNDQTIITREIDLVYALPCSDWPCQAKNFKCRQRINPSWPNRKKVFRRKDERRQLYCCLVPVAHRFSLLPVFEWRYSFSILEALLSEQLQKRNEFILITYRILKYLNKYGQTRNQQTATNVTDNRLNSYCLKTLLFWTCEQSVQNGRYFPEWSITTIWINLKCLFQKLKESLENKQLWNFFIDKNNMIDHLSDEEIESTLNFINQILIDPVQCLFQTFPAQLNNKTATTLILDRSRAIISLRTWSHLLAVKMHPVIKIKNVLYRRPVDLNTSLNYCEKAKTKRREKHLRKYFHDTTTIQLQPHQQNEKEFLQLICKFISHQLSSDSVAVGLLCPGYSTTLT